MAGGGAAGKAIQEGSSQPRGRVRLRLRGFARDRQGAASVEFALISVPFLGLLFAIFQSCLMFLMQQGLEAAIQQAGRQILVGTAQNNTVVTSWQNYRDTYVCPTSGNLLPSFVTCSNVIVDVRPYANFSQMSKTNVSQSFLTDGTGTQYNPGVPCQIVVVRAAYPMPVYLPILADLTLGSRVTQNVTGLTSYNGKLVQMITAAAVFRNEPYTVNGAATQQGGCP